MPCTASTRRVAECVLHMRCKGEHLAKEQDQEGHGDVADGGDEEGDAPGVVQGVLMPYCQGEVGHDDLGGASACRITLLLHAAARHRRLRGLAQEAGQQGVLGPASDWITCPSGESALCSM